MQKTLGGDRLGAGKKMKVSLHNYERSTHNLGYIWRSTMSAGTLVPFMSRVALPGDTFDIELDCDVKTLPTIGPLFGSYKVQLDVFLTPIRLYNSYLHNNALNIGMDMSAIKLPKIYFQASYTRESADIDASQVNPSCILAYLGIRGFGDSNVKGTTQERGFNAVPILVYWDIYKQYYSNKMETTGASIGTNRPIVVESITAAKWNNQTIPQSGSTGPAVIINSEFPIQLDYSTGQTPDVRTVFFLTAEHGEQRASDLFKNWEDFPTGVYMKGYFDWQRWGNELTLISWRYMNSTDIWIEQPIVARWPLENIDKMRTEILKYAFKTAHFNINKFSPYSHLVQPQAPLSSQMGLGVKTYQSDLFNNWLNTEWIDGPTGISQITAISTVGDKFTLDTLNLSKKVYDMLNRIAVSGGTYDDWLDAVYTHPRYLRAETPMYMGGLIKELVFQQVVSNAETDTQPLGTLAGRGILGGKHKGGKIVIKCDEHSYIIGLVSLTPRIDYSQGNSWDSELLTMDDFHKPAFDEIGFQELPSNWLAWWSSIWNPGTSEWDTPSVGKQPAWIHYMTEVNKTYGNFAIQNNEMFMTLNRRYEFNGTGIEDLTTYIDPAKYNFIFAETSIEIWFHDAAPRFVTPSFFSKYFFF